tara:strand:+ start:61 stop:408 length:348 start_codon:yes stop_codon:yes gene_type:complete
MSKTLMLGTGLFLIAQTLVWFQANSQLVWDWWKDKPFVAALVFSLPIALSFWYATKYIYEATGELWTARYVAFGVSFISFPLLTHYFLNESMFTAKTLVCTGLAILIVCIQFFWK